MQQDPVNILVVEEDPELRAVLLVGLDSHGWNVLLAADLVGMMNAVDTGDIGLLALNTNMQHRNGVDLMHVVRARESALPIVVFSDRTDGGAPVAWIECETATDSIFARKVLRAIDRLLTLYRQADVDHSVVVYDHGTFDRKRRIAARRDGNPIDLTELELNLLELFLSHSGRELSRDEIFLALHGRARRPFDRTIDGHVARLRRKLEQSGKAPPLIRTVRGIGYVFTGSVTMTPASNGTLDVG